MHPRGALLCRPLVKQQPSALPSQGLVQRANAARATAATAANSDSSRSHVLYMARVSSVGADGTARNALLSIVDLAGSESLDTAPAAPGGGGAGDLGGMGSPRGTAAAGGRDAETRAINSSLHTLTRVVAAFATAPAGQRPAHVPFRESLLTLMLRDSIGGNCRTSVVVTLSGDDDQLHHSLKSCAFARLARGVSNCARANRSYDPAIALDALRAQVAELTRALAEAEAARDAATGAAAGMAQGSLDGLLASASPSPLSPSSSSAEKGGSVDVRLDSHVRGWVEGALPWDNEEELCVAVRRLAAVADSLRRCVRATGISTRLDSPPREDASTDTTPLRGREPSVAVHAGTQASPPPAPLLAADVRTPSSPPRRGSPVAGSSAGKTTSPAQLAQSEARAALRAAGHSLADACETFASELEARALPAARVLVDVAARVAHEGDVAAAEGRVRMLEAQVALTRTRATELRAVGGDEGAASTRLVDGDATASTSALPPLGPSALRAWQVCSVSSSDGGDSTWDLLPAPVAALLDSVVLGQSQGTAAVLTDAARAVVVVSGSTPPYVMQAPRGLQVSGPAAPAPSLAAAAPVSPGAPGECPAAEPAIVCHPALEAAWAQRLGFDGVEPFVCSILNPWSGVQVCSVTGAERRIRRTTAAVMQGALYKRGARSGAWTARSFMLTSSGLHQLRLCPAAAGAAFTAAAPAAQARYVTESIARTKIAFHSDVSTRAELAPADTRGAHAAAQVRFVVTQQRRSGQGLSALCRYELAVGSLDEATRWVDAINAAAAGAFKQTCVACAPRLSATSEIAAMEQGRLVHFLAEAQLRLQLRSSSGRGAVEALSSAPPLLGGATSPESVGAHSPDAQWFCGRGPAGIPALLPMSPTQWRATGDDLVAELLAADGFARLARILGYPMYSVLVLAAARVQCSAAAVAFDMRATRTATTGRRVQTAFVVASSRAVLRRLVGHAGGLQLPPAPCRQGMTPNPTFSGRLLPRCDALPCGYASAACALDAHVAQLHAVREGAGVGNTAESDNAGVTFSHAASLLAMVVLRAAVPVAQATDDGSGGAMGSESLAVDMFQPVHVVWMQVAPGLATARPSLG